MKKIANFLIITLVLISCHNKANKDKNNYFISDTIKPLSLLYKSSSFELGYTDTIAKGVHSNSKTPEPKSGILSKSDKALKSNPQLPNEVLERTFFKSSASMSNLSLYVGHFVKYNPADSSYKPMVIRDLLEHKSSKPEINSVEHQLIKGIIDWGAEFNGSFLIDNLGATHESKIELSIADITSTKINVENINLKTVEHFKTFLKETNDDPSLYYYVKDMVVTSITARCFNTTKVHDSITYMISLENSTYYSIGSPTTTSKISANLIPLNKFVTAKTSTAKAE